MVYLVLKGTRLPRSAPVGTRRLPFQLLPKERPLRCLLSSGVTYPLTEAITWSEWASGSALGQFCS